MPCVCLLAYGQSSRVVTLIGIRDKFGRKLYFSIALKNEDCPEKKKKLSAKNLQL